MLVAKPHDPRLPLRLKDHKGVLYILVNGTIARVYKEEKETKAEKKKKRKQRHIHS